jgi:hypothetical protein
VILVTTKGIFPENWVTTPIIGTNTLIFRKKHEFSRELQQFLEEKHKFSTEKQLFSKEKHKFQREKQIFSKEKHEFSEEL